MAALGGLAQQQTAFSLAFGEMKRRKQINDDMLRQLTIDNLMQYLQVSYERDKQRRDAKNFARQQSTIKAGAAIATLGASSFLSPDAAGVPGVPGAPGTSNFTPSSGGFTPTLIPQSGIGYA